MSAIEDHRDEQLSRQGKLTSAQLQDLVFSHIKYKHPDVIVRAGIGEDCAVVSMGERALVISTDPITGTSASVGQLAVNINLNDIASNGVKPIGLMLTLLAPVGTPLAEIEAVMAQAGREAANQGVEIVGGHTEITDAVNRIVISAVAFGSQAIDKISSLNKIKEGDKILMTKACGIEGTAIIATEKEQDLLEAGFDGQELSYAKSLMAMTSVVAEGVLAGQYPISAMHDITEGGLLGAIWELCHGAKVGCVMNSADIPIHSVTQKICDHYEIDPLGLISSGSLLIIASEPICEQLYKVFDQNNLSIQEIGQITQEQILIDYEGELFEIPSPEGDALYEVLV